MTRCLLPLLALFLLLPPAIPAWQSGTWEPLAPGVDGDPARLTPASYFPPLDEAGRRNRHPRLILAPEGHAALVFQSNAPNAFVGRSGFYALRHHSMKEWDPYGGGSVWTATGLSLPRGYHVSATGRQMALAAPAVPSGSLAANLYGAFGVRGGIWSERGGSLSTGGLTGLDTFLPTVQQAFTAVDSFDNTYLAWTIGDNNSTGLYTGRWFLGQWQGFGGPFLEPVYTSPAGFRILGPALTFTGGTPVVLFTEASGALDRVRVLRHRSSDGAWVSMADDAESPFAQGRHLRAVNFRNQAGFHFSFENLGNGRLTVMEWTGSTFRTLPDPLEPWGLPRMAPMPSSITTIDPAIAPNHALALDNQGNPAVAFRAQHPDLPGKYFVYVSWLDPDSGQWKAVGDGDDVFGATAADYTVGGAGATGNRHPSLLFTLDNRAVLAWELDDGTAAAPRLRVRRFTRTVGEAMPNRRQGAARLLGLIDPENHFDARMLTANGDFILDAADLVRMPR